MSAKIKQGILLKNYLRIMAQPNHSMIFSFEEKALVIQSFDENMYHYKKLVIPEQNIDEYVYKRRIIEGKQMIERNDKNS